MDEVSLVHCEEIYALLVVLIVELFYTRTHNTCPRRQVTLASITSILFDLKNNIYTPYC
jgi:hypothetical protein